MYGRKRSCPGWNTSNKKLELTAGCSEKRARKARTHPTIPAAPKRSRSTPHNPVLRRMPYMVVPAVNINRSNAHCRGVGIHPFSSSSGVASTINSQASVSGRCMESFLICAPAKASIRFFSVFFLAQRCSCPLFC